MPKKEHSEFYYNSDDSAAGFGYQYRMAMLENPDGTYRVVKQARSGASVSSKLCLAFMSAGLITPRLVKWREDHIVHEYASADEAKQLLKEFDDNVRDMIVRSATCRIPLAERERYAKEKGFTVSQKIL